MKKNHKLLIVQGPSQALNAISSLNPNVTIRKRHRVGEMNKKQTEFLIGCLVAGSQNRRLLFATIKLIRSLGFKKIHNTLDLDARYEKGKISYRDYCDKLRKRLRCKKYDEVYVARRMAYLNEAVLITQRGAKKICYGDGYGGFDNGFPNWAQPQAGVAFSDLDECRGPIVFEENLRGTLGKKTNITPLTQLNKNISKCAKSYFRSIQNLKKELAKSSLSLGLITTSNLTESGAVSSLSEEIDLYLENILSLIRPNYNFIYFVKNHPRQTKDQSKILVQQLIKAGIECKEFKYNQEVPAELLLKILKPKDLIPLLSSTGYVSRLINPGIRILYSQKMAEECMKKLKKPSFNWRLYPEKLQALTLMTSYPWDSCVKYPNLTLFSFAFRGLGLTFPPVSKTLKAEKQGQFKALKSSFLRLLLLSLQDHPRRLKTIQSLIPA